VTITHVGYGELVPVKGLSIAFMTLYMLFSWCCYVVVLGKITFSILRKEHFWQLEEWGLSRERNGQKTTEVREESNNLY
jgi:hypothetical protein